VRIFRSYPESFRPDPWTPSRTFVSYFSITLITISHLTKWSPCCWVRCWINCKRKYRVRVRVRVTANQFVLPTSPLRPTTSNFLSTEHLRP
jgi:hypothetical protein